jgi:hypothetical protein
MLKISFIGLLVLLVCSACRKTRQTACGAQECTDLFASIGARFFDKNNSPVIITDFKVLDLRTNKAIVKAVPANSVASNYMEILDDNDLKSLSSEGDMIQVTATDPVSGQTKITLFKISGGCNCHVAKLSGPDSITFD